MNIILVSHGDFRSNSSIHICGFANALTRLGHDCCVVVPDNKDLSPLDIEPNFKVLIQAELEPSKPPFSNGLPADCIHAWTPREITRKFCKHIKSHWKSRLFVHLEDNEEYLLESFLKRPFEELKSLPDSMLADLVPESLSHPKYYQHFLSECDGVTVILDTLREFVPANVPCIELWPGVDSALFNPDIAPMEIELACPDECIVAYTGNSHFGNWPEVRSLYLAVAELNMSGFPTRLLRSGVDHFDWLNIESDLRKFALNLGFLKWSQIPSLLKRADILVQPGCDDNFNRFRLPSKLPEFLSMGRPVVLPNSNLGRRLTDCKHAVLTYTGSPNEIAAAIRGLRTQRCAAEWIGRNGRELALANFDWMRNTAKLADFYSNPGNISGGNELTAHAKVLTNDVSMDVFDQVMAIVQMRGSTQRLITANEENKRLQVVYEARMEFESHLTSAQNTFAWRVMRLLRRFESQAVHGADGGRSAFLKWVFNRLAGQKAEPPNFDPFENRPTLQGSDPATISNESVPKK
jgi:glycosyltransferase involved in cell wall biosynthesis